ncbi:hypothetical protein ANTPLA_LOCUS2417 [Anthophora plagiata]
MAVRLAPGTVRTLYAIQRATKDMQHQSQSPTNKNNSQETRKVGKLMKTSKQSTTNSTQSPAGTIKPTSNQQSNSAEDNALVNKIHQNDRSLRNNVPERENCKELDDILAKWNVDKLKK